MRQGFENISDEFKRVRQLVVQVAKFNCPTSFVVMPDVTAVDMLSLAKGKSVETQREWVGAIKYAYGQPRPFKALVERFTKQTLRLHLKCEACGEAQAPGYTFEMSSASAVSLLPAMQVGLAMAKIYNVAGGIGRLFFPFVPVIPDNILDEAQDIINVVKNKSSVSEFAVVEQEAVRTMSRHSLSGNVSFAVGKQSIDAAHEKSANSDDEDGEDSSECGFTSDEAAPQNQVDASLRELKAFLNSVDPSNTWGGLTMIEVDERTTNASSQRVLWVCPACLSGQAHVSECAKPAAANPHTRTRSADTANPRPIADGKAPPVDIRTRGSALATQRSDSSSGSQRSRGSFLGCFGDAKVMPES